MSTSRITKPVLSRNGVISPGEVYTTNELKKRLGWGSRSLNRAKKDGLKVRKYGNTRFVMATDLIQWIENNGEIEL